MLAQKLMGSVGGASDKLYVDDVFSTYLYTGNGSTQTINNGFDLAGKGGLVWNKRRGTSADTNRLFDTARGAGNVLNADSTGAQGGGWPITFNSAGHSIGVVGSAAMNTTNETYVSWTFRKAPKFFDVVTYTGNNGVARTISHSLGQAPGMIIVKCVTGGGNWHAYHRSIGASKYMVLNTTAAEVTDTTLWNNTAPTSSVFSLGTSALANNNGDTFVAYLFAHDPSADGIVQCGSFTTDASGNATVNLGWEPQYLLVKTATTATDWFIHDMARGIPTGSLDLDLRANLAAAESADWDHVDITATGFVNKILFASQTLIYLAIRRPNKPPTLGTQVYNAIARTGTGVAATVTGVGFAPDVIFNQQRYGIQGNIWYDRLRGATRSLFSASTVPEGVNSQTVTSFDMGGMSVGIDSSVNGLMPLVHHFFRRAPGFMDVVCYTGTGVAKTEKHGLGIAPKMIITKTRSIINGWRVYHSGAGATGALVLDSTAATSVSSVFWNSTEPTSTVFTVGSNAGTNYNLQTMVAYLFATLPGISKVGSYTGNGSSQTINCGFTTGARFILVKRTDATGDWYVWDSVRGIVSANDPHLSLNTTAAEVTTDDSIDPDASGFIVNQVAATNINVNAASYIYLAIA